MRKALAFFCQCAKGRKLLRFMIWARKNGYAAVVFTPEELAPVKGAERALEEKMIQEGWYWIEGGLVQ
jgi:hypothetical protein